MIYLDYAAHAPADPAVLERFCDIERRFPANPNSIHMAGKAAREEMARVTEQIAALTGASPAEVIFTSGATEANNLAIKGIAQASRHIGKHIISTPLEHSSVSGSLTALQERGWEIDLLSIGRDGTVDPEEVRELLRPDTVLVAICAVDSELGTIQPVNEIAALLADHPNCRLHVDATQAIGRIPVDFSGIDTLSFAPHKFGGICGSGVLLKRSRPISDHFKEHFRSRFEVSDAQIFLSRTAPLKLGYAFSLGEHLPEKKRAFLSDAPFTPQQPAMLSAGQSLLKAALQRDILLSYPYESMEPFLQMIREAANDPAVLAIRITIYRLASKAKLVEYLCAAAENGKDVTALIELRARFDEQNNIDWSERMEEAGCKIIYGFEDYKVHSKICLITRRERGAVRHITQVGTGNYNEKTAKQYTDVSLITADERIGQDAGAFFNNMALGNLSGRYSRLFVAPTSLKNNILALMDEQIAKGKDGYILLKFNSLTDIDVIAKLREASCAGVTVEMIVRGICCLLPGVPGHTENITVTSIVGRFLEHSRIYVFGRGDEEKMYISSADLMTRNTERRVEIACPIDDPAVRTRLHDILYAMQHDTVKARVLQPDGTYCKKPAVQDPICAQDLLMQQAIENARKQAAQPAPHPGFLEKIRKWFSGS